MKKSPIYKDIRDLQLEFVDSNIGLGDNFAERYQIQALLGAGGMGRVYLAKDLMLAGDPVALKILNSELVKDDKQCQRFLREVQLTRKISHPNVVKTFEVGNFAGQFFFTMEYVPGETLKEKIELGAIEAYRAANIISEIAKGLSAIHQAGIIHRDLKPANVIITKDGQAKIADFGIARLGVSDLTGHNEVVGSAAYMSPEVWTGRDISNSADLYSLGILAYEILTGDVPFDGNGPAEVMCKHLELRPLTPSQVNNKIPLWLDGLVMKMLEKTPSKRPASAADISEFIKCKLERRSDQSSSNGVGQGLASTGLLAEQASSPNLNKSSVSAINLSTNADLASSSRIQHSPARSGVIIANQKRIIAANAEKSRSKTVSVSADSVKPSSLILLPIKLSLALLLSSLIAAGLVYVSQLAIGPYTPAYTSLSLTRLVYLLLLESLVTGALVALPAFTFFSAALSLREAARVANTHARNLFYTFICICLVYFAFSYALTNKPTNSYLLLESLKDIQSSFKLWLGGTLLFPSVINFTELAGSADTTWAKPLSLIKGVVPNVLTVVSALFAIRLALLTKDKILRHNNGRTVYLGISLFVVAQLVAAPAESESVLGLSSQPLTSMAIFTNTIEISSYSLTCAICTWTLLAVYAARLRRVA